ncbi:MAG TPA: PIN domain-containing protein [Rhizobiaceae bacterium]|nr:PIN domain-containing protein [Rhizobiaceae bacterium]
MNGERAFLDTNVLLYLYAKDDAKADKVDALLRERPVISVQVLNEFINVSRRKFARDWSTIIPAIESLGALCEVVPLEVTSQRKAVEIAVRDGFSIYDANIVTAAAMAGCTILFSEDMQHSRRIEGLTIVNPFA